MMMAANSGSDSELDSESDTKSESGSDPKLSSTELSSRAPTDLFACESSWIELQSAVWIGVIVFALPARFVRLSAAQYRGKH